jgi:hypothetical protein
MTFQFEQLGEFKFVFEANLGYETPDQVSTFDEKT